MGSRKGSWYLRSETDSRWEVEGEDHESGPENMTAERMLSELEQVIGRLKDELGDPPDDLEGGFIL